MLSFCLTVEIVCIFLSLFVQIQTAVNPDRELTHDSTTYSVFIITTGDHIRWTDAQDICIIWGGNLATIKSEQIDTLLSYLTDITTHSATWIGLNDISDEADTDASRFVWVDGSDSTYRQFATSPEAEAYPRATHGNWDCVSFRYNRVPNFNTISNGWHDRPCGSTVFSYFCSKPGTSNGCDLIYEDYCYQIFTESIGIDWDDAQSTCTVWGGDLTSVPTQRVNNFIRTVLPDTNSEYWIGLYEENGNLKWIDGSTSSYTNMISSTGSSCVTVDTDGNWLRDDCNSLNNFICRRNSNFIAEYEMMRELTFEDSTFAIFTTFPRISWSAARDNCMSWGGNLTTIKSSQQDTLLYNLADIDVYYASWIGLNDRGVEAGDTPNEFVWVDGSDSNYRLFATNPFSYPSGVKGGSDCVSFRYKYLNVLSDGWYDRECDGAVFSYYCQKAGISNGCDLIYEDSCYRAFEKTDRINWNDAQSTCAVWGGNLTSISSQRVNDFMQTLRSNTNSEYWIGLNGDRHESFLWNDGTTSNYRNFRSNGVSNFNSASCVIMESDGEWRNSDCADEVGGFICNRSPTYDTGYTAPNTITTSIHGIVQNGSVLFFDEDVITMYCTISNPTYTVEWYYRTLADGNATDVTSLSVFSPQTGIGSLDINSHELGYYDCIINRYSVYSVFLIHNSSLVTITSFNNPSQQMDYTVDSTSILFYSQSDVPDNSLRWTTDAVSNGENQQYSIEYTNPVDLRVVFSDTGAGVQRLSCFYRMSPVTLLGSLQIAIRDHAMLTISYEGYSNTFNDVNNSMFPSPQMISILENTTNVTLSCSQCLMIQSVIQDVLTNITNLPYVISVFSEDNAGSYMLLRETPSGIQYTTAHVYVSFTPNTTSTTSPSMTIIYIVVPVCVIVAFILLVVIIILIFCLVKYWKRNTRNMKGASEDNKRSTITSIRLEDTSDGDHPVKPIDNGYMTLDQLDMEVNIPNSGPQDETTFTQTITYEEATDIMDPRMLPISLDIFKSHMDSLWKKECGLEEEYMSLGGKEHRYPCQSANILDNKPKNRFKLIYPYDKDRVLLDCTYANTVSDYINASHIPGIYVKEKFIAAQGPKENTIESFWQMIIENKVVNIVMLTNLVESGKKKCEKYFPLEIGSNLVCGPYNISLEREELFMGYAIKMLKVIFPGGEERVKHFHFTAWPDHDVPSLYDELLTFVTYVQESLKQSKAPIVVHCSAGVGRTGTFITLYNITNAIKHKSSISIYRIVHEMREHRPQMVQTFAQYKFIYLSVLEILLGTTSIKTKEFLNTYKLYMKSEYDGYVSVFYQQFSELNYQCEKGFSPDCEAALLECNRTKNPVKNVLPYDMNRVELCSQHWGENYINATSLDSGQIIVTIDPTQDTLRDFYQLIYQMNPSLIIMLSSPKKLKQIQQGNSDRVVYWPTPGNPLRTEPFTVTHSNSEESSFIKNIFDITHNIDNCSISCTQIIVTDWNEKDEPKLENIISLLQTIFQSQKQSPAAPVLIHCEDGAGKSGVLYTVYKAMKESKERGLIDIFHIAKKLRSERMNSVSNLTQFVSCFTLMNEYCSKAN